MVNDDNHSERLIDGLDALWSYLEDSPKLGAHANVDFGPQWHSQRESVFDAPGRPGECARPCPAGSIAPFQIMRPVGIGVGPERDDRMDFLDRPWEQPKVLINNQESSGGRWRLTAAADRSGIWASQQFSGVWPTGDYDVDMLAAILNGPLANAFATEHSTGHGFTNVMLERMPLPRRLDRSTLGEALSEYNRLLDEKLGSVLADNGIDQRLDCLVTWIDALVLDGYDLPPRLERQLFDYFAGWARPTLHPFNGWLPADFRGFVPLREWLTRDHQANRGAWVLDVFKPVPDAENEALSRFIA